MRKSLGSLVLLATFAAAAPAYGQDAQWSSWTKVELSGALGTMMRLFAGKTEGLDTTFLKGARVRTNADKHASIVDLENGRFIDIDHNAKTYTMVTMAQIGDYMKQAEARQKSEMAKAQQTPSSQEQPKATTEVKISFKVDRTGEKQKLLGYDTERVFTTVESDVTVTPTEGPESGQAQPAGKLVVFMDSWLAKDVPAEIALRQLAEKAGPEMRKQSEKAAQTMIAAITADPNAQEAMKKAAAEAEKTAGFELKGTMHIVLVPPGLKFERDLVLAEEGKKEESTAKRALGGMLRGAIGAKAPETAKAADPKQWTLGRVRSEVRELKSTSLPITLFEPPAGYREIRFNPGAER
jgi:hypothetical protein